MRSDSVTLRKRVAIVTNNVNCERHVQYYSNIEKYFIINGWEVAEDFNVDKVIICCCGFHDVMHEKVIKTVKELKDRHFLENNIIIMGCQSKTHEAELMEKLKVKIIGFNREKHLDDIINARVPFGEITPNNLLRPFKECNLDERNEYFHIKIAQGCLTRCTFCVINKAKGYIKSTPDDEILKQFRKAIKQGKRRIYLMGEDTLAYGKDTGSNIIELVESMLAIDSQVELNFGSLHIKWLLEYKEGILSLCKRGIVKELHVGLQHVNDRLLKRMGRPIVFSELYRFIKHLKKECPDVFLEADILVGFPGETEEMFAQLVEFFEKDTCFNNVRHFAYSDVKGAPSYKFDGKLSTSQLVRRWEIFDKTLQKCSSNYKSEDASMMDVAFQLTHERNYTFCKDTFKDEIENVVDDPGLMRAKSKIRLTENDDFTF
ncbi:MAG: radical SAM protein [Candidatus Aminicenantes bacterium]|nr:MAG: radical SAM protein [Candidatus Aminicenantes bacterium]